MCVTAVSLDLLQLRLSGSYRKEILEACTGGSEHGAEGHLLPKNPQSVRRVYNYTSHPHAAGLLEHSIPLGVFSLFLAIPTAVAFLQALDIFSGIISTI